MNKTLYLCIILLGLFFTIIIDATEISSKKNLQETQIITKELQLMNITEKSISFNPVKKIKVAIIDSGVNKLHPDIHIPPENAVNFIQNDLPVVDEFNHGTAIAGIIAAKNNNIGIVGIAHNAEIFDLKVLDDKGKGNIKNLVKAIDWCIENEIDIINISFGFQTSNDELYSSVQRALQNNIIIVAAAGNTYGIDVDYPAKYENVISVNSINPDLEPLNSSASGKIDFVAPGFEVISTDNENNYSYFTGSSFSTAYVTGIIANLISRNLINSNNVIEELRRFSHDISRNKYDEYVGNGLIKFN